MSIPETRWLEKGKFFSIKYVNVICDDELRKSLSYDLSRFDFASDGIPLSLNTCEKLCFSSSSEAFRITVREEGIRIEAISTIGLHHGLSRLAQLIYEEELYEGIIEDSPSFKYRGLMLDVSRGKMATIDYIKELIDFMSSVSMNVLQLYMEDKHRLNCYPEVGSLYGCYSPEDIKMIDEYASSRFIELQPNIQTFSHMHGIVRFPGYSRLAENDVLFSFSVAEEDVFKFFEDGFKEVFPLYSSKTVNLNMDEAYDLGSGKSKESVEKLGRGKVFLDYITRVSSIAKSCGAEKVQIWGDFALKYPDLVSELPDYITLIDWNYNPEDSYPSIKALKGKRKSFWAAPGVSSWNSLFPRVYNSLKNIRIYSADAFDSGAEGYMNTDWGDYGHYQCYGFSFLGYLYGAECSWNIHRDDNTDVFWNECKKLLFADDNVANAFKSLMDSNLAENIQVGFKTMSAYAFFDDMLTGLSLKGNEKYPAVSLNAFKTLKAKGEEALNYLKSCATASFWNDIQGEIFIEELKLAAEMTAFTGDKGILSYHILNTLESGKMSSDDCLGFIIDIKRLYTRFEKIRETFTSVWLQRARRDGMEGTLFLFDKAAVQLSKVAMFLAQCRERILKGDSVSIKDYVEGQGYTTLWTSDFRNMWDRAYPWQ